MIDTLLSVFVLALAASGFFALLPTIKRSELMAKDESRATQMAQRIIEHIQLLKVADLNATTLTSLNLIDTGQTTQPYAFTNIPLDEGSKYSPAQMLKGGTGQMTITTIDAGSARVKITISWKDKNGTTRSVTCGTIVGGFR